MTSPRKARPTVSAIPCKVFARVEGRWLFCGNSKNYVFPSLKKAREYMWRYRAMSTAPKPDMKIERAQPRRHAGKGKNKI